MTVCAVVVTRNRTALLRECLAALEGQTCRVQEIIVVDNASTDDTVATVRREFPAAHLLMLSKNEGGAGGFHEGMKAAMEKGFDWIWLMDDDTIPTPTALERLLESLDKLEGLPQPLILASKVVWTDGLLHPKNLPAARLDETWGEVFLSGTARGLLLIRSASFVSILVSRQAVVEHGLPHKHYFIWGDDGEYTARVMRDGAGYLVPGSVVHHKTAQKESVHLDRAGSRQYYYELRNKLFWLRGSAWRRREKVHIVVATLMGLYWYLARSRFQPRSLVLVARAVRDGLTQPAE